VVPNRRHKHSDPKRPNCLSTTHQLIISKTYPTRALTWLLTECRTEDGKSAARARPEAQSTFKKQFAFLPMFRIPFKPAGRTPLTDNKENVLDEPQMDDVRASIQLKRGFRNLQVRLLARRCFHASATSCGRGCLSISSIVQSVASQLHKMRLTKFAVFLARSTKTKRCEPFALA
jgi:hypothetical protein